MKQTAGIKSVLDGLGCGEGLDYFDAEQLCGVSFGRLSYQQGRVLQNRMVAARQTGHVGNTIIFCEHDRVITLGKRAELSCAEEARLLTSGIEIVKTDRGGLATYHGPGQIMIYPVCDLRSIHCGVRSFISKVLTAIANTLREYGIAAQPLLAPAGVWVRAGEGELNLSTDNKIAAVGLRIQNQITNHGCCLNYEGDLAPYSLFAPCGIEGSGVTNMQAILGMARPTRQTMVEVLFRSLVRELKRSV